MSTKRRHHLDTICLVIIATVVMGMALWWLRPVMIPFMLALFLTYSLAPLLDFLRKHLKLPQPALVFLAFVIVSAMLFALSMVVTESINQVSRNAGMYQRQLVKLVDAVIAGLQLDRFGIDADASMKRLLNSRGGAVSSYFTYTLNTLFNLMSQGILVIIMVVFMLLGQRPLPQTEGPLGPIDEFERRVKTYISTKTLLSAVTGVMVWLALTLFDVELAIVFGLFAFLLNFIPNIGSIISTVLPIPLVVLSADVTTFQAVFAIGVPGCIQFVVGNVIEPKVMGDVLDLHPIVVLLALIFWGMLWGLVGMLLATPITASIKILLERSEYTRPAAQVLAGKVRDAWPTDEDVTG